MTPGQIRALTEARDQDEEIVCDGLLCYVGDRPISRGTVKALLNLCALKDVSDNGEGIERYIINSTGNALLRRPELENELQARLLSGAPFTIINDRIEEVSSLLKHGDAS